MSLRTRLTKLERNANRPQPDVAAILRGVAEQVAHRDRETLHEIVVDWQSGGSRFGELIGQLSDEAIDLVVAAFNRAGIRGTGDSDMMQRILSDAADDPGLSDNDRETAQKTLADLKAGRLHPEAVIPAASDELLAALERALRLPPPHLRIVGRVGERNANRD